METPVVVVGPMPTSWPAALMRKASAPQVSLATLDCECPVAAGKDKQEEGVELTVGTRQRGLPTFPCAHPGPKLIVVLGSTF